MKRIRKWPWITTQQWDDLLFMHWPVPYEALRPYVPKSLELETYDGHAWVSIIPFHASKNCLRGIPFSFCSFLETNVRTYVRFYDEPGVYFFSMDAGNMLAVAGARRGFSLPYFHATMHIARHGNEIAFESQRNHKNVAARRLSLTYKPEPHTFYAKKDTVIYWLTERYCLYAFKGKTIMKGTISHTPWQLQNADFSIEENDFLPQIYTRQTPLVQFSKTKVARVHPFETVGKFS